MTSINTQYLPTSFVDKSGNLTVPEKVAEAVATGVQARIENLPPAEKQLFLDMLRASSLAPSSDGKYDVDGMLNRIDKIVDTFGDVSTAVSNMIGKGGIDLLARALIEMAADQRKSALESRLAAREEAKGELMQQAGTMRSEAAKMIAGAIVSAIVQIIGAGVSIGFSASAMKSLDAGKMGTLGKDLRVDDFSRGMADVNNAIGGAVKSIGDAVGNMVNGMLQGAAKLDAAQGTEHAAEAEEIRGKGDMAKELGDAVEEMIKAVINFLKELKDAQAEQMRSLTKL